jgi:hypothetical protein
LPIGDGLKPELGALGLSITCRGTIKVLCNRALSWMPKRLPSSPNTLVLVEISMGRVPLAVATGTTSIQARSKLV